MQEDKVVALDVVPIPENPLADGPYPKQPKPRIQSKPLTKFNDPKVADHVAKILIKNNLDYQKAAKEIEPDAASLRIKILADKMEESQTVQKALKENLEASGLDDKSKDIYVKTLWDWMLEGNKSMNETLYKEDGSRDYRGEIKRREAATQYAIAAARILSRAFIQEKPQDNKPMELRIKGWGDMVDTMTKPVVEEKEEENV
jgi:hypothetical protein